MSLPEGIRIDEHGVWIQVRRPVTGPEKRPALFLDRDGVIIEDRHYMHKIEDVFPIPGAAPVIAQANRLGIPVIVVTNQAGIAHKYYGWEEFALVQAHVDNLLAREGAYVDGVFACPHHPKGQAPYDAADAECRKPNPGMVLRALEHFPIDAAGSWIIGDRSSDLGAGKNAGLAGGMHVLTGHGSGEGQRDKCLAMACDRFRVVAAESVAGALDLIPLLRD